MLGRFVRFYLALDLPLASNMRLCNDKLEGPQSAYPVNEACQLTRAYRTAQADLQFRLRCQGCNRRAGFRITIFDERTRGDSSKPRLERVVVTGE